MHVPQRATYSIADFIFNGIFHTVACRVMYGSDCGEREGEGERERESRPPGSRVLSITLKERKSRLSGGSVCCFYVLDTDCTSTA